MPGRDLPRAIARLRSRLLATAPLILALPVLALTSCASGAVTAAAPGGRLLVVAAENFWGSIAAQLGGDQVQVISVIANPNTDPHSYEPTAADARAVAFANVLVANGIGYDPWMTRLTSAAQNSPVVLNVGDLLKVPSDGNPHRWYNPADVQVVASALTAAYTRLRPARASYFAGRLASFETAGLRQYHDLIVQIRGRYAGTPVGASESIFAMLAPALGLRLITPTAFLRAISEGTEVSAADKAAIDQQIRRRLIKIYVYNSQNVTPDVQAQLAEVKAAGIPTATITETLVPPAAAYQRWQVAELQGILAALRKAARQ